MDRIKWLDGLKGVAALIVAFNHYFHGHIDPPYRSFWDSPVEENRHLIQLPPIRLLWQVYAMVPLLMVASGYSISQRLLHLRDSNSPVLFLRRLQSSAFRRPLRLYLPVCLLATISQVAFFTGLYNDHYADNVLRPLQPWTGPMAHVKYLCRYLVDGMNPINFVWTEGLNGQYWSMPHELRGSYIVYLVILTMCFWRPAVRVRALTGLLAYLLWYGHWDVFSFVGGLYLAELQVTDITSTRQDATRKSTTYYGRYLAFLFGIYLLCLRGETELPPEYRILSPLQPDHWTRHNEWCDARFSWNAIGSALVVFAISGLPRLQRPLNSRPAQYLGSIAFPLYLVHELVFRTGRNWLINAIWGSLVVDSPYPWGQHDRAMDSLGSFLVTWLSSGLVLGAFTMAAAHFYVCFVELRFERWVNSLDVYMLGRDSNSERKGD
ncbi:acyltransferase 3 [Aspergillus floccosus]